jgi:hypothetical protein
LPKNLAKKMARLTQTKGIFAEKVITTLVFEENANFFAENWQKSQKIVIITSVPDWAEFCNVGEIFRRWAHFLRKNIQMIWAQFFINIAQNSP